MSSYWAFESRAVLAKDLGHSCRECKGPFLRLGEEMVLRRGGRIELKYHGSCFSWEVDPRTQKQSTFSVGKWQGTQQVHAPKEVYRKMRTGAQF
jgi:hypothetical protein